MGRYPIPITDREKKHSEENEKASECLVYYVDPKKLEEMYPTKREEKEPGSVNWKWFTKNKEEEKVSKDRLTVEMVRQELQAGLTATDISEKYNKDMRVIKRMVKQAQRSNKVPEPQTEPIEVEEREETAATIQENPFTIETMEINGKLFKYRIQGTSIVAIRDNRTMKFDKSELDSVIQELNQLKNVITNPKQ